MLANSASEHRSISPTALHLDANSTRWGGPKQIRVPAANVKKSLAMTTEICQSSRLPRLFAAGSMAVDAEDYDGNGRPSLHGRARLMLEVAAPSDVVRHQGGGYLSSSDRRHLFGLGRKGTVDRLTVAWLCGES